MREAILVLLPWIKAVHLASLLVWCAGLFALPALLALFPAVKGGVERKRLLAATRFMFIAVSSPAAVIAIASGTALIFLTGSFAPWLLAKLTLVTAMVFFHAGCGKLVLVLHREPARYASGAHLALALIPTMLIPAVLWLVLAQPVWSWGAT